MKLERCKSLSVGEERAIFRNRSLEADEPRNALPFPRRCFHHRIAESPQSCLIAGNSRWRSFLSSSDSRVQWRVKRGGTHCTSRDEVACVTR